MNVLSSTRFVALAFVALLGSTAFQCPGQGPIKILAPAEGQLSLPGDVPVEIKFPRSVRPGSFQAELDGADVTGLFSVHGKHAEAILPVPTEGEHELVVIADTGKASHAAVRHFEVITLAGSDDCEVLNQLECLLPYPSDHFRKVNTEGVHELTFPQEGLPQQSGNDIPASFFTVRDGFSPTAQILMHFPAGVDVEASGLARLEESLQRSTDLTSLQNDSPSVLLEKRKPYSRGTRVLHWLENDARVAGPERRLLFMRPGRSLEPGKRYIVALRNLVDDDGNPVEPEPVFRALRDGTPTTIPAVEARRAHFEEIFFELKRAGVRRGDLVLAFDFTVASDENLTGQMLSMRDQSFEWLAAQDPATLATVDPGQSQEFDCSDPDQYVWKQLRGRYKVPLFLNGDIEGETDSFEPRTLQVGPDGFTPFFTTTTNPEFGISIPCSAQDAPLGALVAGHGLFGDGPNFAHQVNQFVPAAFADFGIAGPAFISGGTHWRGLSKPDFPLFIGVVIAANIWQNFPALPDRLRQGQLNQLMLARMMKQGLLNAIPDFQAPPEKGGHGVFLPGADMPYYGISLGGVMGLMFSALTPDVERLNVDVPSINFSLLLQRASPFEGLFQDILDGTLGPDPMTQSLGIQLIHELWVTGEPAGYATHITEDPLPGTNAKQMLVTQAHLDHQVSNQATEISARTLGIPQLVGSYFPDLPLLEQEEGPLPSAYVIYDTGSVDPNGDPQYIPPLANQSLPGGLPCDPHGRRLAIPASFMQLAAFLEPGGLVENFCDGECDADTSVMATGPNGDYRLELPGGDGSDCPPAP